MKNCRKIQEIIQQHLYIYFYNQIKNIRFMQSRRYHTLAKQSLISDHSQSMYPPTFTNRISITPKILNSNVAHSKMQSSKIDQFQQELSFKNEKSIRHNKQVIESRKLKKFRNIRESNQRACSNLKQEIMNIKRTIDQTEKRDKRKQMLNKLDELSLHQKKMLQSVNLSVRMLPSLQNPVSPRFYHPITPHHYPYNPNYFSMNRYAPFQVGLCYCSDNQLRKPKKRRKNISSEKNRLKRMCRKAFLAVAYIIFLKNLAKKIREERKRLFKQMWPTKFKKFSLKIGKWVFLCLDLFFEAMIEKSYFDMSVDHSLKGFVQKQRNYLIKSHLKSFVQGCKQLIEKSQFHEVCKIMHQFCKHGASSTNQTLTLEQLSMVSISEANGYLVMDKNLEKSQIINFLFFKIVIFNILLQPWKYNEEEFSHNEQTVKNFYHFAGVLYRIMKEIQKQYLELAHSVSLKIGNWKKNQDKFDIKYSQSLHYHRKPHEEGEIISGLISQQDFEKGFPRFYWEAEKQEIIQVIENIHKQICRAHEQFINFFVYKYKDEGRK